MSHFHTRQRGISLVELMVGIGIALILLTGVLTVMLRVSTSGASSVQSTRLNQQIRGTVDFVTKELQRAGYVNWYPLWDADGDDVLDDINTDGQVDVRDFYVSAVPQMDLFGQVSLWSFPTPGVATGTATACTTDCDCVLYSYDLNEDGMQGVGVSGTVGTGQNTDNFEMFGIRRNANAVQIKTDGDAINCTAGSWANITDDQIRVTDFTLSQVYATSSVGTAIGTGADSTVYTLSRTGDWDEEYRAACEARVDDGSGPMDMGSDVLCLERRNIGVFIRGELQNDAGVEAELRSNVKIKNDFFNALP